MAGLLVVIMAVWVWREIIAADERRKARVNRWTDESYLSEGGHADGN